MILKFQSGININVLNIFGSPQLIDGVMRDTLSIEVSPKNIEYNNLKSIFTDSSNTFILYSFDTNNEEYEIGKGYTIFVSITDENRKIKHEPGYFGPDEYEEVYIVKLAQMTYSEYQLQQLNNQPSD